MIGDIQLYTFRYLDHDTVYVGVIAQELLETHPYAVHLGLDGYYSVDYHSLGITFQTLEQYQMSH